MPWANLRSPVDVGQVNFVPSTEFFGKTLTDQQKHNVVKYLSTFKFRGNPVTPIAISGYDGKFSGFTKEEWEQILHAASALVFASVCPVTLAAVKNDDQTRVPPSSDRFLLCTAYLQDAGVTQDKGGLVNFEPYETLVENKPSYVIDGLSAPQETALELMDFIFKHQDQELTAKRIFRSVYFFARAQTNSPEMSEFAKLILLGTAFEILFHSQAARGKKKHVMEEIDSLWTTGLTTTSVKVDGQPKTVSSPAAWYQNFYQTRNKYIHGETVGVSDLSFPVTGRNWLTHRIIASIVYKAAVSELVSNLKIALTTSDQQMGENVSRVLHLRDSFDCLGWIDRGAKTVI